MSDFIKKLQKKPRRVRVRILWISVILVMAFIFFFWLNYLKSSLNFLSIEQGISESKQSIPSIFGVLKEDFSILKKSLGAGLEGLGRRDKEKVDFEVEIIKPSKLRE